jgi:hypothetical protein
VALEGLSVRFVNRTTAEVIVNGKCDPKQVVLLLILCKCREEA